MGLALQQLAIAAVAIVVFKFKFGRCFLSARVLQRNEMRIPGSYDNLVVNKCEKEYKPVDPDGDIVMLDCDDQVQRGHREYTVDNTMTFVSCFTLSKK